MSCWSISTSIFQSRAMARCPVSGFVGGCLGLFCPSRTYIDLHWNNMLVSQKSNWHLFNSRLLGEHFSVLNTINFLAVSFDWDTNVTALEEQRENIDRIKTLCRRVKRDARGTFVTVPHRAPRGHSHDRLISLPPWGRDKVPLNVKLTFVCMSSLSCPRYRHRLDHRDPIKLLERGCHGVSENVSVYIIL